MEARQVQKFERPITQEKMVNKLLTAVDSITERFQRNFDAVDQLFKDQVNGTFKKYICPDLNRSGYNSVLKYLDIYAALLDCNVHVMVNGMVSKKHVATRDYNRFSLVPIFDSLRRDNAPHVYLFRVGENGVHRYHVITNIVGMIDVNFGYLNFCEGCYQTTYATSDTHKEKYCNRVTADSQFTSHHTWRIDPDNLEGAVNSTPYAKRASDEEMADRYRILARLMLDDNVDEHCGCKQPLEQEDSNEDESVPLENTEESIIVSPRAHKRAKRQAAKQLEEDMSYFDSDEECNKSEYA